VVSVIGSGFGCAFKIEAHSRERTDSTTATVLVVFVFTVLFPFHQFSGQNNEIMCSQRLSKENGGRVFR
jgi:hypothetical protein